MAFGLKPLDRTLYLGLGFGAADNEAVALDADGTVTPIPRRSKDALADFVWDLVAARLI